MKLDPSTQQERKSRGLPPKKRKKRRLQKQAVSLTEKRSTPHKRVQGRKVEKRPAPSPFSFENRLSQTFYAHEAYTLKKDVVRGAHRLVDKLVERGFPLCRGVDLQPKLLKKQVKKRISDCVNLRLAKREELPFELREYDDFHGELESWAVALEGLAQREQSVEGVLRFLDELFASGEFDLERVYRRGHQQQHAVLHFSLEAVSRRMANQEDHDAILVAMDLIFSGVAEWKKMALYPLLESTLQQLNGELDALQKLGSVRMRGEWLREVELLPQERFCARLIGSCLDLHQHGFANLAQELVQSVAEQEICVRRLGGMGPQLFTVLIQVMEVNEDLQRLNLNGVRWVSPESIVRLIQRHPELEELDLSYCRQMHSESLDHIGRVLFRLKALKVAGLDKVHGSVIEEVVSVNTHLTHLDVSECDEMRVRDVEAILEALERREGPFTLNFKHLIQVPQEEVQALYDAILDPGCYSAP